MSNLPPKDMDNENEVLSKIHEGMAVLDQDGHKIGKVEFVQMSSGDVAGRGAATPTTDQRSSSILDDFAKAFSASDELTDDVKSRLLFSGFVRMDSDALLRSERYILPEQIAYVSGEEVHLNAKFKDLAHR